MMELVIQYDRTASAGPAGVALLSEVAALLGLEALLHDADESKTIPLIVLTRTSRDVARLLADNFLRAPAHRHLLAELDKRHSDGLSWSGDVRVIERTLAPWWRAVSGSAEAMRRWRPGIDAAVILASMPAAVSTAAADMNAAGGTAAAGRTAAVILVATGNTAAVTAVSVEEVQWSLSQKVRIRE